MNAQKQNEDQTDPSKGLASVIDQTKTQLAKEGFVFLFWGWIVFLGTLASGFVISRADEAVAGLIWVSLCVTGSIISAVYYNTKRNALRLPALSRILGYVWGAAGIGSGMLYFAFIFFTHDRALIIPVLLCITGIALFATGRILKFIPCITGGVAFWIFTFAAFFFQIHHQFLISASAILIGYLIPVYILRYAYGNRSFIM